jgi:sigma-E factor negative regulatory protein RseB
MVRLLYSTVAILGLVAGSAGADTLEQDEALSILEKIAAAARQLNYVGIFVYQHGDRFERSRIAHYTDGNGEFEKLETLDGPRREVIRNNDEVLCFYPDAKIVRSEKRVARRTFPALLPERLRSLTEFYRVRKGEPERIAGYDSQALILEPKDGLRYGHQLWADTDSGLLLKARMLNEQKAVVEQFTFTQLTIGSGVSRDMVAPSFNPRMPEWRIDQFAQSMLSSGTNSGWVVKQFPAGFRKILEMQRTKQGSSVPITHLVYSDGLAAVSIFIEPAASRARIHQGASQQGAINVYTRTIDDQVVTVLGEAPASTVMQIANSVSFRGK